MGSSFTFCVDLIDPRSHRKMKEASDTDATLLCRKHTEELQVGVDILKEVFVSCNFWPNRAEHTSSPLEDLSALHEEAKESIATLSELPFDGDNFQLRLLIDKSMTYSLFCISELHIFDFTLCMHGTKSTSPYSPPIPSFLCLTTISFLSKLNTCHGG